MDHRSAHLLQHLHDLRLVRPPEVPPGGALEGDLISWGIAFFEYLLQVPANRIGAARFTPVQLKVMQEIITLVVFAVFTLFYFSEHLHWNHAAAGVCLVAASFFVFHSW